MSSLNETPRANRLHIGFFGKRNSGKSSLVNAFAGHNVAIVSDTPGTTTDTVHKSMEIHGLGPCVLMDTAGFDDEGALGALRVEKTREAAEKTDIAVLLFSGKGYGQELEWLDFFKKKKKPVLCVLGKADTVLDVGIKLEELAALIGDAASVGLVAVSAGNKDSVTAFKEALVRLLPEDFQSPTILGSLVEKGDLVLLVMPQDIQAPKGRLILPQVQVTRELLDRHCIILSTTVETLGQALKALAYPPKLIITDSQVFGAVYAQKPETSMLTSFSILFAVHKGDITYYIESAAALHTLTADSWVLIAECCTHAPMEEDIGRVKIPAMLRKKVGQGLQVDIVSGSDFPQDLTPYTLVIQCGGCMFNRAHVLARVERAKTQHVPMTNYGIVLAELQGILDKVVFPVG